MEIKKEYLDSHIPKYLDEYRDIYFENTAKALKLESGIIIPAVVKLMNKNHDFNIEIMDFIKETKEETGDWNMDYSNFLGFGAEARERREERRKRRRDKRKTRRDNKNTKKLIRKGMLTQAQIGGLMNNQQLTVEQLNEMGISEAQYSLMQAQTPELPPVINSTPPPPEGLSSLAIIGIISGVIAIGGLIFVLKR